MKLLAAILSGLIFLVSSCTEQKKSQDKNIDTPKAISTELRPIDVSLDSLASKMIASKGDYSSDSGPTAEELFIEQLMTNLRKSESLKTDFYTLEKYNIKVLTSDDGRLKLFYWLSPNSGSMWHVQNIIQYRTPQDSLTSISFDSLYEQRQDEGSPTPFFEHMYVLKPSIKPMYLLLGNGQMSGMEPYAVCRVLSWENGQFTINKKLFNDGTVLQSELFTPASLLDEENPDEIRQMLKPAFDPATKTLTYAEAKDTKDGTVFTGKRKTLLFDDGIFK